MHPRLLLAVLRHPTLWIEAWRSVRDTRRTEWWRRLLLVPEPDYLRWRVTTAYGDPGARVEPGDLVRYLRWRQRQRAE